MVSSQHLLWDFFGPSWVSSVQSASISYWLIAAIGEDAAAAVEAAGYGDRCILFPKPANESSETAIPGRGKRHRHHHRGAATSATSTTGTSTSRSDHSAYRWLSAAWKGATWGKVAAVTALVDLGFDVVHSDVDVSWFRDPLPLFLSLGETRGPTPAAAGAPGPTAVFSTDLLTTTNKATDGADSGLERSCIPSYSLNTGVYWVRGSETGSRLMNGWMAVKAAGYTGDDQQGLNLLVRGTELPLAHIALPRGYDRHAAVAAAAAAAAADQQNRQRGLAEAPRSRAATAAGSDPRMLGAPRALHGPQLHHLYLAAGAPGLPGGDVEGVVVGCLPVSSFSHTYAFATTELHKVRQHPLYEVHWVWAGKSLESKRQCMRDARVYDDPPEYYRPSRIMTFELEHVELPPGYNTWPASRTADMVTFSLAALSAQLQQAYWALALAAALNRTLVLPKFRCYCAKTWFATSACRITSERDTVFPFTCPLSHVFRARLLSGGDLRVADPLLGDIRPGGGWRVAEVREYSFLSNPRTDPDLRSATPTVLRIGAAGNGGGGSADGAGSGSSSSGSSSSGGSAGPTEILLSGARTDRELQSLLLAPPYDAVRVLHVPRPATVMSGFADAAMWQQYDTAVQRVTATWCCWSSRDVKERGGSRWEQLQPLPPSRRQQQQQQ